MNRKTSVCFVLVYLLFAVAAHAQIDESHLKNFMWRNVGPAGAGGRIVDLAVGGENPQRIYAATASGGLYKSSNNGTTWEALFDDQATVSIGDVAIDPANPDTVWVGTGEANGRNSVSWGDGVYKSTDGGKTWKNMGLKDSRHVGRVIVDPRNANTVYVAALGHMWGPNRERGLYKTTDSGLTWTNTLFINEDTGFVDLAMDPHDNNTLYAAAYQRRRDGFAGGDPAIGWGPGSGLYKTTDGGRNWKKLSNGLPGGELGRIGLDVSQSTPNVVYAIVQTSTTVAREGQRGDDEGGGGGGGRGGGGRGGAPGAQPQRSMRDGGVFRSEDRGETWRWMNTINPRPFYYSQIRVDPTNENRVYVLGNNVAASDDGGRNFTNMPMNVHVDHHALWIDPKNPRRLVLGNDGGVYSSWDQGRTWDFHNQMAISQFYAVDVDMQKPYFIYGGVQDYCSWGGPSATRNTIGITTTDWYRVQTGDGFQARVDPTDHNIVYAESQNGGLIRHDKRSGRNVSIRPRPRQGEPAFRFNWETPIIISPHAPGTIYVGANFLFKSTNRGDAWTTISPDLTTNRQQGSITTIAESPLKAGLLYAGTDDGNVHVTRDGGATWKNITDKVPGMPDKRWVSRVIGSRFHEGTAYLTFDGHRNDDYATYIFKTTDYGETWTSIKNNLPDNQSVRVVREDYKNRNLLFTGTEFGAYVTVDGGGRWTRLMKDMPTVAVADLVIHPRDSDLIAGTHGRSIYIVDISPLQQLTETVLAGEAHLFTPKPAMAFNYKVFSDDQFLAEKRFVAPNPAYGSSIGYYLKAAASDDVKVSILDRAGNLVRELTGSKDRGINFVQWDLRANGPARPESAAGGGGGGGFGGGGNQGPMVDPGQYTARMTIAGRQYTAPVVVEPDPLLQITEQERQARRTLITSLLQIIPNANSAVQTTDSLNTQITTLSRALVDVRNVSAGLKTSMDSAVKQAADLLTRIRRASGRFTSLYGDINGHPFPPTAFQITEFDEAKKELDGNIADINKFIPTLANLESQMNKENIPRIKPVEPVKPPGGR